MKPIGRPVARTRLALAAAAVAAVCGPRPLVAQPAYTLDDWMTVSRVASFVWSADGSALYYTSDAGPSGTLEIFRVDADGSNPTRLGGTPPGPRAEPVESLLLSPDGEALYYVSARYFQGFHNIWRLPVEGGEPEALTFNDAVIETAPSVSPDGSTLAYFTRTDAGARAFLLDLDDRAGRFPAWPRRLEPGAGEEQSPSFSPDGARLAFRRGGDIWVRDVEGGEPRRVVEDAFAGGNGSFEWAPDGSRLAFTNGRSGYAQIGVADLATGAVTPITYEPREHGDPAWSPDGRWLAFVRATGAGMGNEIALAPTDGAGETTAAISMDSSAIRASPSFSPDGRWLAWLESSDTRTQEIWKVRIGPDGRPDGDPIRVTDSMGRVDPADLSRAEEVSYPGPDNLPIPTLLYRPRDFDPSREYPVIVRLHGHPGQWSHSFELMRQYFVDRGFVVVAPNPRGSRGFGQGFHDLHIADYGGVELRDVLGVVDYLDGLGYVDMSRKATWGGSGGGYMSFVIATEAPDAFQAQVIRAPVSDWKLLAIDRYGASGRHWTAGRTPRRERSEFGGSYEEIPEEYERRSPINFVERVRVPQLLFHGLRDASVPARQSQVWAERMRAAGNGDLLTYVEYPDEDHSLVRYRATVRDRIARMSEFLALHLHLPELAAPDG